MRLKVLKKITGKERMPREKISRACSRGKVLKGRLYIPAMQGSRKSGKAERILSRGGKRKLN